MRFFQALAILAAVQATEARAEETSNQPYIDQLKATLEPEEADDSDEEGEQVESNQPYIDRRKKKLSKKEDDEPKFEEGYIEHLRSTDPTLSPLDDDKTVADPSKTYLEKKKAKLGPPENESAIEAFKEGRSELKGKRKGDIHHALSFQFNASHDLTASGTGELVGRSFEDLYGTGYIPRLALQYEYQPFHSEWIGSFGILLGGALTYNYGKGKFEVNLRNPVTGESFGIESKTKFTFFTLPVSLGLNYRLNLLRYVRPYVQGAGLTTFYRENRTDEQGGNQGMSFGMAFGGGLNLLMDWVSAESTWAFYRTFGVKHYYLTLDYTRTTTFAMSKRVNFAANTISLGLTFEY